MYPQSLFTLLPPYPRSHRAFVAMSFAKEFTPRWERVLEPALRRIAFDGAKLEPFRVDTSMASDAILTEILQEIATCRLIVADISALHTLDHRPVRNANVMYEVGIAHATRLPEEVILLRSDDHALDFDIAGVRVHSYSPDDAPAAATEQVIELVVASQQALDRRRTVAVTSAAAQLTEPALLVLFGALKDGFVRHPRGSTLRDITRDREVAGAIQHLLSLGALRATPLALNEELLEQAERGEDSGETILRYCLTPIGNALIQRIVDDMGLSRPDIAERLSRLIDDGAA